MLNLDDKLLDSIATYTDTFEEYAGMILQVYQGSEVERTDLLIPISQYYDKANIIELIRGGDGNETGRMP